MYRIGLSFLLGASVVLNFDVKVHRDRRTVHLLTISVGACIGQALEFGIALGCPLDFDFLIYHFFRFDRYFFQAWLERFGDGELFLSQFNSFCIPPFSFDFFIFLD